MVLHHIFFYQSDSLRETKWLIFALKRKLSLKISVVRFMCVFFKQPSLLVYNRHVFVTYFIAVVIFIQLSNEIWQRILSQNIKRFLKTNQNFMAIIWGDKIKENGVSRAGSPNEKWKNRTGFWFENQRDKNFMAYVGVEWRYY